MSEVHWLDVAMALQELGEAGRLRLRVGNAMTTLKFAYYNEGEQPYTLVFELAGTDPIKRDNETLDDFYDYMYPHDEESG